MNPARTSQEVLARSVEALVVASERPSVQEAVWAVRGLVDELEAVDVRRVAACLAVLATHSPPAGPADVLGWLDRLRVMVRRRDEVGLLEALWSGESS